MTNAEKYLKDGASANQFLQELSDYFEKITAIEPNMIDEPYEIIRRFLEKNTKPTLTEDERVILRNVKWKGYSATHIGRESENKGSYIYIRFENDIEMVYFFDNFFGHLFQFIKERRRI